MRNLEEYVKIRKALKQRFENERAGEQFRYADQSELFKPIIEAQKETSKDIKNTIVSGQEGTSNVLIPFTNELRRRNDQIDELQTLPFYNTPQEIQDVAQFTPVKKV